MALTGQLSDMSLAELIEFFCNQRKTGRLKIDYPRGHSVFFIKDGELVDAKVGALSGVEAVYFSLTLPNAAFDFSPDVHSNRRTINESWTQVVLEGLRRLDEGLSPTEADAFSNFSPTEAEMVAMFDQVERLGGEPAPAKETGERRAAPAEASETEAESAPLSMMVESANGEGGGRKKWMALGVAAAVVLVCAVAAIPLSGAFGSKQEAAPAAAVEAPAPEPVAEASAAPSEPAPDASAPEATAEAAATEAEAAEAARRERERRERREREERERKAEERAQNSEAGEAVVPKPAAAPAGPKSVRVTVTYDENGRVTQASVAGTTPGAEAYGSTAVRIARGRRFPAGKAGSTVVTIPVN
jgi:TonB family protein